MPEHTIASHILPAGTLVTARSFLVDRIKPDCEIISLPKKVMKGGTLTWSVGPLDAAPVKRPEKRGLRTLISGGNGHGSEIAPKDRWLIDLRSNSPANWAHFLNNHLPLLFAVANAAGLDPSRALAILPTDIPGYIKEAAQLFGIETYLSNATVKGRGVTFEVTPWSALRTARSAWVQLPGPQAALSAILSEQPERSLPRKVFLTRKTTRALSNAGEIEALLMSRGFKTVLPETLSPVDQFRLFLNADEIVAIHGAGLAPLLYCSPGRGPKRFIELLPCGHMTDVYRVIAAEVGCAWVGVRGRIKPEYIPYVYRVDEPAYVAHSLDAFEIDPVSLERAFTIAERQAASLRG